MTLAAIDRSNIPDHAGSKERAQALAERIQRFWHERGGRGVVAWAQHDADQCRGSTAALFVVRSNLIGGLPPRAEARA